MPPTITISSPVDGGIVTTSIIEIETQTSPDVGRVEFFRGIDKLGEDLTPPFTLRWAVPNPGQHTLYARATSTAAYWSEMRTRT